MTLRSPFHIMAKPTGAICNLDCHYCFYLEKELLYPETTDFRMTPEMLTSFIRQHIENHPDSRVDFTWQGGEPTLAGIAFFRKAVELQQKYANGKMIGNAFQTNGILLNDEWCEFLAANQFLVGISIDGPEAFHNRYRVHKGGQPSFNGVMKAVEKLKKHGVDFNTLTVLQKHNADSPLEVYRFLREIGSGFMQFIPIVERISGDAPESSRLLAAPHEQGDARISEWSVEPLQYGHFLARIFDEWVRNDVGKYFVQIFDVALESWMGMAPTLCIFRQTCGQALALEHNGDLYACDHYVYPENKLGNIMEQPLASLLTSPRQQQFGQAKKETLPGHCLSCEVKFACNGECPKHRFLKTPDGAPGLNYLCAGYRYFFNYIDPYMKFMANELRYQRPPANVMHWAREKDRGFPNAGIGRNDPCCCGSGKKLKKCCGAFR